MSFACVNAVGARHVLNQLNVCSVRSPLRTHVLESFNSIVNAKNMLLDIF